MNTRKRKTKMRNARIMRTACSNRRTRRTNNEHHENEEENQEQPTSGKAEWKKYDA